MRIGMLLGPGFEDLEFWAVYMRMVELNADIVCIGPKANEYYPSKSGGLPAKSDSTAEGVSASDLDALLVPGGWAPDKLRRDKEIIRLVKEMHEQKKILGFICHAGWVAASAGIVKGRKVTGSMGVKDDMVNAGGIWVDKPAFRDEHIVWGRVVADIPYYNRELVEALKK